MHREERSELYINQPKTIQPKIIRVDHSFFLKLKNL